MAMTREVLNSIIANECGGNWKKISFIALGSGGKPMWLLEYLTSPGKGVNYIDEDLGNGQYKTGFLFWDEIPPSIRDVINAPKLTHHEVFYTLDSIERIGCFRQPPNYVTQDPPGNPWQ